MVGYAGVRRDSVHDQLLAVANAVVLVLRGAVVTVWVRRNRLGGETAQRVIPVRHRPAAQLGHRGPISCQPQRVRVAGELCALSSRSHLREPVQAVVIVGSRHPVRIRKRLQVAHFVIGVRGRA